MSHMLEAGAPGDPRTTTTPTAPPVPATRVPPEAVDRVLATAADLAVTGRRITARELALLTWLEPETIEACLDRLCASARLVRVGPRGQQFAFPQDRWPPPQSVIDRRPA